MSTPKPENPYVPLEKLNQAYTERMIAVRALVSLALRHGYLAGIGFDESMSEDSKNVGWGNVVYVLLPEGQISWHISPMNWEMFKDLPKFPGSWDGTFNSKSEEWARDLFPGNFVQQCLTRVDDSVKTLEETFKKEQNLNDL